MNNEVIEVIFDSQDELDRELKLSNALMGAVTQSTIFRVAQACKSKAAIFAGDPRCEALTSKLKRLWLHNLDELDCVPMAPTNRPIGCATTGTHPYQPSSNSSSSSSSSSNNNIAGSGVRDDEIADNCPSNSKKRNQRSRLDEVISRVEPNSCSNSNRRSSNSFIHGHPSIFRGYLGLPAPIMMSPRAIAINCRSISNSHNEIKVKTDYTLKYVNESKSVGGDSARSLGFKRKNRSGTKYNSLPFTPVDPSLSETLKIQKQEKLLENKKALILTQTLTSKNMTPTLGMKVFVNFKLVAPDLFFSLFGDDAENWKIARVSAYSSSDLKRGGSTPLAVKVYRAAVKLQLNGVEVEAPWDVDHIRIFHCHVDPNVVELELNEMSMYEDVGGLLSSSSDDESEGEDKDDDSDTENNYSNSNSNFNKSSSIVDMNIPFSLSSLIRAEEGGDRDGDDSVWPLPLPDDGKEANTRLYTISSSHDRAEGQAPFVANASSCSSSSSSSSSSSLSFPLTPSNNIVIDDPQEPQIASANWRVSSNQDIQTYLDSFDFTKVRFKVRNHDGGSIETLSSKNSGGSTFEAMSYTSDEVDTLLDIYKNAISKNPQLLVMGKIKSFRKTAKVWNTTLKWVLMRICDKEYVFPMCKLTFNVEDMVAEGGDADIDIDINVPHAVLRGFEQVTAGII